MSVCWSYEVIRVTLRTVAAHTLHLFAIDAVASKKVEGGSDPRQAACGARRATDGNSPCGLGNRHEAAREAGRRPLPNSHWSRKRPSPLPGRVGGGAPNRRLFHSANTRALTGS
jgi:hypothetical protein